MNVSLLIYAQLLILSTTLSAKSVSVRVQARQFIGPLTRIWESTGLSPGEPHERAGEFLLSKDMEVNLAYIGTMGWTRERQVRIHWLLDLVKVIGQKDDGNPMFEFSQLDKLLATLWRNGLKPGFELMGNPSNIFTDFENFTQLKWLEDLTEQIGGRYVEMFGLQYVSRWNFETWNEPDHKHTWDPPLKNPSVSAYLRYFEALNVGLRKTHPNLRLGGPGGSCRPPLFFALCRALLSHCEAKKKDGRRCIDFISFHKKGGRKGGSVSSGRIIADENTTLKYISENYPYLASLPVFNDEGDPEVGWASPRSWRSDVTYAALAVKILKQHYDAYSRSEVDFRLLSNDNAFLSYFPHQFEQRTLLARFQMNETRPDDLGIRGNNNNYNTTTSNDRSWVQFFVKPIYSALALMTYMGEILLRSESSDDEGVVDAVASTSFPETMLADRSDSPQMAVVVFVSNDTLQRLEPHHVFLDIEIPPAWLERDGDLKIIELSLSNDDWRGNPHRVWLDLGRPPFPDFNQSRCLRSAESPVLEVLDVKKWVEGNRFSHEFKADVPTVKLLHFCRKSVDGPRQITNVTVASLSPLYCGESKSGIRMDSKCEKLIMVTWNSLSSGTKCIFRYEVSVKTANSSFNYASTPLFNHLVVPVEGIEKGAYAKFRVRSIDYFDRGGPSSASVTFRFN